MTIHDEHPFAEPEDRRDPVRRLRGRLGGAVSLWTAGDLDDPDRRSGLTVSSLLVLPGEPARVLGLVDPDSDLADELGRSGRCVVQLLRWPHRDLAEQFAGTAPAPGGPFRQATFEQTAWGPRLVDAPTWLGMAVEDATEVGWSLRVTGVVEELHVGADDAPLEHRRGRYARPS
jgi:flavin reductase (DIM6/NTAB) family NADH-FMN oxidoreductase RutF